MTDPSVLTMDNDLEGVGEWQTIEIMSEFPYSHRINFLLKIYATLAKERVTAMGSPSGMKATL